MTGRLRSLFLALHHTPRSALWLAFALCAGVGVVLTLSPWGQALERDLGLSVLFNLRGERPAPPSVAVISIDRDTLQALQQPAKLDRWSRRWHARLVDRLQQAGVKVAAFDMVFAEARDAPGDAQLAQALRRMQRTVLIEYWLRDRQTLTDGQGNNVADMVTETRVKPLPELQQASFGIAPFPLPRVPIRVSQAWLMQGQAERRATFPLVSFIAHHQDSLPALIDLLQPKPASDEVVNKLSAIGPGKGNALHEALVALQHWRVNHPRHWRALRQDLVTADLTASQRQAVRRLHTALGAGNSIVLDYYGPPGSILTIPYHRVLDNDTLEQLRDRTVFVGLARRLKQEQQDSFYTVFTQPNGDDLGGVEIAATVFANLWEGRWLEPWPVWQQALFAFLWAAVLVWGLSRLGVRWVLLLGTAAALLYFALVYYQFTHDSHWWPWVVPLIIQMPLIWLAVLLAQYQGAKLAQQRVRKALSYYVPGPVAERMAREVEDLQAHGELVYGACLYTDAQQYTQLAENMAPAALRDLMNDYYHLVFEPVLEQGGMVSDVVGDAMMAVWTAKSLTTSLRSQVCQAALGVRAGVARFNREHPDTPLPTRVGVHCGQMLWGNVGALDHYEYRAVGDIVNSASRIEGLNKHLGTDILITDEVLHDLHGFAVRHIGRFRLAGKQAALNLYHLVCEQAQLGDQHRQWIEQFEEALRLFWQGQWQLAEEVFARCPALHPGDRAAQFYVELCREYQLKPPSEDWRGEVILMNK